MRNHPRVIPSLTIQPGAGDERFLPVPTVVGRNLLFSGVALAFCTFVLVAVFSPDLQAQEPVPLAQGNTPGEPHHHLKIENEYVRVYYVEAPPHEATLLHQHDHDYIYVSLGPADVVNAILNKPEIHLQLKDGETHFTRGGFAHVARNLADTPFRNITIELLKAQTDPKNVCEKVAMDLPVADCAKSDDFSKLPPDSPLRSFAKIVQRPRVMFATEQVRLMAVSSSIQGSYTEGDSMAGRLLVVENGSNLEVEIASEPAKPLRGGEVEWLDGQKKWKVITPRTTTRFLLIQFKNSPAQ